MPDLPGKAMMPRLLLGTSFALLLVAVVVQGTMLSMQGRRLSALEEQVRDLQGRRLSALEEQVRDLQRQDLRMADAMIGPRRPARSLGQVDRDVAALRRSMAEARQREAGRPTR